MLLTSPPPICSVWNKTAPKSPLAWEGSQNNRSATKWNCGTSSALNTKRSKPTDVLISALPINWPMRSVSSGCWTGCPTNWCRKPFASWWDGSDAGLTTACEKANARSRRTNKKACWTYWNSAVSTIPESSMPTSRHTTGKFTWRNLPTYWLYHTYVTTVSSAWNGCAKLM